MAESLEQVFDDVIESLRDKIDPGMIVVAKQVGRELAELTARRFAGEDVDEQEFTMVRASARNIVVAGGFNVLGVLAENAIGVLGRIINGGR
jgi:hypothetical protein